MEQELEKMESLKMVYADIILNTAKEAAARIMVSERKAIQFQQNVCSTKEEALNMLLRVKQVMDSKIADMEMTSLRQRLKIEVLEAQLNEAEDVVTDLRAQLQEVQNELENTKNGQFDELTIKSSTASHENSSQANELKDSEAVSSPLPYAGSAFEDASFNQRKTGNNCCFASKNVTKPTQSSGKFHVENYCAGNPDFASIIMTSKEPELYRNGCTQRIRAFERNFLNGKLPIPVQTTDQDSNIKTRSTIKEDETAEVICTVASLREQNMGSVEKKPIRLLESLGKHSSSDKVQDVKFIPRVSLRKSKSRYRKAVVVPCGKAYLCPGNSLAESGEDLSRMTDEEIQKNLESHLHPVSSLDKTYMDPLLGSIPDTGNKTESTKAEKFQNAAAEDKVPVDTSNLSGQDGVVAGISGVPNCWLNYEAYDLQTDSNSKDVKTGTTNNEATTQAADDRLLKYTFQRKRKKESLSCHGESESQEKNTPKKRSGEKQIGAMDLHKSSLTVESSRDSRRLAQVARQLISLSEKRW